MAIRFTVTSVQPQGEKPMTWETFQERLAKARKWNTDRTSKWWQEHSKEEQERQAVKYGALESMVALEELAHQAFDDMKEGENG